MNAISFMKQRSRLRKRLRKRKTIIAKEEACVKHGETFSVPWM